MKKTYDDAKTAAENQKGLIAAARDLKAKVAEYKLLLSGRNHANLLQEAESPMTATEGDSITRKGLLTTPEGELNTKENLFATAEKAYHDKFITARNESNKLRNLLVAAHATLQTSAGWLGSR
jgi:hypothetical protein